MPSACLGRQPVATTQGLLLHGDRPVSYTLSHKEIHDGLADKPSLYVRLGGVYSIATVVDDFINRIMIDPRLNSNPLVDEAHHRVPPAGFKYLVTEMVCWATGGPQNYTGKSMAESHKDLKITSKEWEAFLDDFQQTLDKFAVPTEEQAELKLSSTAPDRILLSTPCSSSRGLLTGRHVTNVAGSTEWVGSRMVSDPEVAQCWTRISGLSGK